MRLSLPALLKAVLATAVVSIALPVMALDSVKMMIGANPGGGYDQTGRGIGKAMQDAGVAKSVQYENKGGAGGTIGLAQFVNSRKGDGEALVVVGAVMVGAIVQNKPPITMANATPIARLFSEYNVWVVPSSSPIKSLKDVADQLKKDPASVKFGGGSKGSVDHIGAALFAKANGVDVAKLNYIPFAGGGEASAAILGGHVTVGTSGYAEMAQFIDAGKMRAIAVTSAEKLPGVNVPTLKEQGFDVVVANWRGVYGAPGITAEQRKALTDAVVAGTKQKSWEESLKKNDWAATLLTGDDFGKFVDAEHARLGGIMKDLGLVK